MGLRIYAVSEITQVNLNEYTGKEWDIINVESGPFKRTEGIKDGQYTCVGDGKDFHAGSYSSYNFFRKHLSLCIYGIEPEAVWENIDHYSGKSFFELIYFSDCEGFIGPLVSKKLHNDFVNNRNHITRYCLDNFIDNDHSINYILEMYDEFTEAFRVSSNNGVLIFS
jgi:hypothetical protein